jgi:UDP-N-acetylglucosamine--N-acetylmuramyl-(pentapeptide) pyrophosphoryl-undecaprenol N-acetylglucosamine transferase
VTDADRSVLLAAGGTGGHLFPAFALAEELGRRGLAVDLVTDMRGDRYGTGFPARRVYQVPSATLKGRSPAALAQTGLVLSRGVLAAWTLLRRIRPAALVGFGGYPTIPPLIAARMLGIPAVLHEQNAVLGRANKMLAKRASAIATSFERTRYLTPALSAKARLTGNPVRDAVIAAAQTPYAAPDAKGRLRLVVFGGSQGARFFSDLVPPGLAVLPEEVRSRLFVTLQAREEDVGRARIALAAADIEGDVASFFKNLPALIAESHIVIARAGASTVAELAVIGRPSILVPLPHSLDNDQLENATNLAESGGSWCIEQKDFSPARLAREIERLAGAPAALAGAARAARSQGRADAVKRLADLVEEQIQGRGGRGARAAKGRELAPGS